MIFYVFEGFHREPKEEYKNLIADIPFIFSQIALIKQKMEQQAIERQMSSTNRKVDKIFNVRKVQYKQFDHEKYLKPTFSPFQAKEHLKEPISSKVGTKKGGEYNFQVAIISSSAYKDLTKKYAGIKEQQNLEKQKRLNELKDKEAELGKFKSEKQRIDGERQKLMRRRDQLRMKIEEIRERNEILRAEQMQRNEQYRMMNMEYLKNMIFGMRYQDGMDIDVDNMTYEEMLELEQKMGSVSKGLNQDQIASLTKKIYKEGEPEQLCSICYYNAKDGEEINVLPCKHSFHVDCIKEWLEKEKVCPMCKQEISQGTNIKSTKNLKQNIERLSRQSISRKNIKSSKSIKDEKQQQIAKIEHRAQQNGKVDLNQALHA